MTDPDFARVQSVFLAARDLDPDARRAILDRECGDDDALRAEVESLLTHHDTDPKWAETPASEHSQRWRDEAIHRDLPRSFGRYELLEVLGVGGMGTVYRARQEQPQRVVALKIVNPGFLSDTTLKRFERESEMLGRLQHPGIARIYEAGAVDSEHGTQPYFAMELIDGDPLDAYARTHSLDVSTRVELLMKICRAAQHAHERGVVHRDLKPANILVDGTGQPRVLDFGVARATDADMRSATLRTSAGQLIGTLPYMSPEQVSGHPGAVDHRSDVYALGVLLYELLARRSPYDLERKGVAEAARIITTQAPTRLSETDTSMRGDLETIIGKALEKDPDRRYQSAANLADDLQRFLSHEPVLARPPSLTHQAHLFVRRHRILVAATSVVIAALIVATVISVSFGLREQAAAQRESRQRLTAERISEYLTTIIDMPDPHRAGADTTVVEMTERVVAKLDATPDELPEVEAAVRSRIGRMYLNIGRRPEAIEQLKRAAARWSETDSFLPELRSTYADLGLAHSALGDFSSAVEVQREALRIARLDPPNSATYSSILSNLAASCMMIEQYDEARPLFEEALVYRRRSPGPNNVFLIAGLRHLGRLHHRTGAYDQAESTLAETVELCRASLSERHPIYAMSLVDLGRTYLELEDDERAEPILTEAWGLANAARTPGSRDWELALIAYIDLLIAQQKSAEADSLLTGALKTLDERGVEGDIVERLRQRQQDIAAAP